MKILVYDIIRLPVDKTKKSKNINKNIYNNNYILYFWNSLDKIESDGISNYGGFIKIQELKKLIGKKNFKKFKKGQDKFYIFIED